MSASSGVASARPDGLGDHGGSGAPAPAHAPVRGSGGSWWRRLDDWVGLAVLVACCTYTFLQLQPELLVRNTTPSGGDMGAHVWWPAYLRDHLLPWRLAGWSPDFYAGFPAGHYYFPVPALAIVGLGLVAPYNVAFKLVTALGPVLLPVGAYVFARGLRAPSPAPAMFALAASAFAFFTGDPGSSETAQSIAFNQRIMGGTLASNLAGEYSFTLALSLALLFLGALAWALRTRRHLWVPALLLALTLTSHLVVGVFAGIGALAVWCCSRPIASAGRAAAIGVVGGLLSAVWVLPLVATLAYTTDMRYEPITEFTDYLVPGYFFEVAGWEPYRWGAYVLVGVAAAAAAVLIRRSTFTLLLMAALCGLAFRFWTDLGSHVWNLRLLPFWYLSVHLLVGAGIAEVVRGVAWLGRTAWGPARVPGPAPAVVDVPGPDRVPEPAAGAQPDLVPGPNDRGSGPGHRPSRSPGGQGTGTLVSVAVISVLTAVLATGWLVHIDQRKAFLPYWAKWNYSGYENVENEVEGTYTAACSNPGADRTVGTEAPGATPLCVYDKTVAIGKQWPEYRALLDELATLPPGRSLWEGGPSLDKYGTPLALMLVPYWTKGRITTMEGVYFEASATTPYHFEAVAALVASGENSNPVRGIPYRDQQSFDLGVRYLQRLGVRYFIAHNPLTRQRADGDPRLTPIATTPDLDGAAPLGWSIYRVADAPLVEGLAYEPVVAEGVSPDPDGWEQQVAVPWWWFPAQLDKPVVADGPDGWRRAPGAGALALPRRRIRPVEVRNVEVGDDSISFDVDRTGAPVLVKVSYFPNWRAHGAQGPWRATPNFMVVVPTDEHVRLTYGTTGIEWLGRLLTLAGLAGLGVLVRWGRRRSREPDRTPAPGLGEGGGASNPGAGPDEATTMAGAPGE